MSVVIYNILLVLLHTGISIASLWNKKGQLWLNGRKNIFEKLSSELSEGVLTDRTLKSKLTWFHCSSLGEFEQGRPVIESLKSKYPDSRLLITFFSPSGFEIRKNYKGADWVFYLPPDSKTNARKFLDIVNPSLVVFVKYDYWYYYLTECKKRDIPLLMISAIFRKNQPFFLWYGNLHRKMLKCFTHFFVQDENSKSLLQNLQIENVTVAGDTRFDRVIAVAENFNPINEIEKFCDNKKILVAGSTWPNDEKNIKSVVELFPNLKIIIAPHEIHEEHLRHLTEIFPNSVLFSQFQIPRPTVSSVRANSKFSESNILIIDNIGMLSKLYAYATITYIGGGFDKGIHNVLEAAVYGKPVIFGPRYKKYKEAIDLKKAGGGFSVSTKDELITKVVLLLNENTLYKKSCENAKRYVYQKRGATEKITWHIQEKRLLTN